MASVGKLGWKVYLAGFALIAVILYSQTHFDSVSYHYRDLPCIEHLRDGSLYGGQLECVTPPMYYLWGSILDILSSGNIQTASYAAFYLLHCAILFLVLKILDPRKPIVAYSMILIYCIMFIPLSVIQTPTKNVTLFDTLISIFFTVLALKIYRKNTGIKRLFTVSSLLMLSFFTKYTALAAVLPIFVLVLFDQMKITYSLKKTRFKLSIRIRDKFHALKSVLVFLAPFAFMAVLLNHIYPHIWVYTIQSHTYSSKIGLSDLVFGLGKSLFTDVESIISFFITAVVAYYFLKSRDVYAFLFTISHIASYVFMFKYEGNANLLLETYYMIYPSFLLLLVVGGYLKTVKNTVLLKKAVSLLVLASLFFGIYHPHGLPSLSQSVSMALGHVSGVKAELDELERKTVNLKKKVDHVYTFLPKNRGLVLVDMGMYEALTDYETPIELEYVVNRNNPPEVNRYIDPWFSDGLLASGVVEKPRYEISEEEYALAREIESGKYEMVFVSPTMYEAMVWYALENVSWSQENMMCRIFLPKFKQTRTMRHWSTMLFKDQRHCQHVLQRSVEYYDDIFDEVCRMQEFVANDFLKATFQINSLVVRTPQGPKRLGISKTCDSGADFLERKHQLRSKYTSTDTRLIAALFFVIAWLVLVERRIRFGFIKPSRRRS